MKAEDIILQLMAKMPKYHSGFTTSANITSMFRNTSGPGPQAVTCVTEKPHGLDPGDIVTIHGVRTPITTGFIRTDGIGVITTSQKHNITLNLNNAHTTNPTVTNRIEEGGVLNDNTFLGTFPVLRILNRFQIEVQMDPDDPDLTASGAIVYLIDYTNDHWGSIPVSVPQGNYNGLRQVTNVVSDVQFEFENDFTGNGGALDPLPASETDPITMEAKPRITGAVDLETVLEAYTKKEISQRWAFVTLEDVEADNARRIETDARSNYQSGHSYQQVINQPCTVTVFIPCSEQISGRAARDEAHTSIFQAVNRSILMYNTDSYTGQTTHGTYLNFDSHGKAAYTGAVYAHSYRYNLITRLQFEDTVGFDEDDTAFRDIDLTLTSHFSDVVQEDPFDSTDTDINLDDEPL